MLPRATVHWVGDPASGVAHTRKCEGRGDGIVMLCTAQTITYHHTQQCGTNLFQVPARSERSDKGQSQALTSVRGGTSKVSDLVSSSFLSPPRPVPPLHDRHCSRIRADAGMVAAEGSNRPGAHAHPHAPTLMPLRAAVCSCCAVLL